MYQFVKAVCLSRSIGSQWQEIDISNILVYDIFANYSKVYLELSNIALEDNVYVDLDSLKSEFSGYNNTLNNLLILINNRTLETVQTLPSTAVKYAKYSNIFRSEYKANITQAGVVLPDNYPEIELHDVELTRPKYSTDMSLIHSHCLVSVNGFFHDTDTDGNKAYVYKAADTMRKSNDNHMGILSFLDIGQLTKVRLNRNNILPETVNDTLRNKIHFTVTESVENKSVILVLGGYLIFPSANVFWQNGNNSFVLDLNHLQYIERIYESSLYMDMSGLQLTTDAINPDMINTEELWSDEVIKNYMTLSQSFLVIVDVPQLTTNKIHLRNSNLPGTFTSYRDPVYPLVANYGKVAEYWKIYEAGFWSVNVKDSFLRNYIFSQQQVQYLPNVTSNLVPSKPFHHSRAYLLEIAGYHL